ncbi:MAG: hypothetical protein WD179_10215 [Actinomycetota bacterium]
MASPAPVSSVDSITAYAVVAAAAIGAFAAIAAWRAASHSKAAVGATLKTAEADLLNGFLTEYHGNEIRRALGALRTFRDEHKDDLVEAYRALHPGGAWTSVSIARRTFSSYFYRLLALYEGGYVSRELVRLAAVPTGYALLLEVVEPLEYAHDHATISIFPYVRAKFDALVEICGDGGVPRFEPPPIAEA